MKSFWKIFWEVVSNRQHFSLADRKIKVQLGNPSELEPPNNVQAKRIRTNFVKLAGWQLFGVAISWVGIFQVEVILGGNSAGRNCPGGNFPVGINWVTVFRVGGFMLKNEFRATFKADASINSVMQKIDIFQKVWCSVINRSPASNNMFKVNNRNTRTRGEICSKFTIKTLERHHWFFLNVFHAFSSFYIISFEQVNAGWESSKEVLLNWKRTTRRRSQQKLLHNIIILQIDVLQYSNTATAVKIFEKDY